LQRYATGKHRTELMQ